MRKNNRCCNEIRQLSVVKNFIKYAEGSAFITLGNTKVLCVASLVKDVPAFLKNDSSNSGWLTAEYSMLPRSTPSRIVRESVRGKPYGRSQEIQRLIGRTLRTSLDLKQLRGYTIKVDCDVIQADGGTRTAAISGAALAVKELITFMYNNNLLDSTHSPIKFNMAAVSVGICRGELLVDLDYSEDCSADTDMNIIMTDQGELIEIQGTGEKNPFSQKELFEMLSLARKAILHIIHRIYK